ncbi:regulator of (H+)-ATPase in vacuolar membrane [Saccharomyces pastorianus]|uniref:Regulator of (H+)-ATPase in vacuolar membrane n=1 Tax=Saccharomyces pastorianus TaxID=27292 RepID=A0A6C1DUE0_SACPS|nr:regulator of (H+)-ATPase in vacuolar membrane [Saccharomyces pastorianus]
MSLNFLPGRPNDTPQTACQATWQKHTLFAYCSGNNLIILSNKFTRLQTIYTQADCTAVDINSQNGFIALSFHNRVLIYKPIHQIMQNPKWTQCCQLFHDDTPVNCLRWSSDNELAIGSDFLSFWKIKDNFGIYQPILQWNQKQPKPVYNVIISQDSQLIVSVGKYDSNAKLWKRISMVGEQVIFNLTMLAHPKPITAMRWRHEPDLTNRKNTPSRTLYTLCEDKVLRIWSCFEMDKNHTVQLWGEVPLSPTQKFCVVIDNWIIRHSLNKEALESYNISKSDIVILGSMVGEMEIIALHNLSQDPPKPMTKETISHKIIDKATMLNDTKYVYFPEVQPYDDLKDKISFLVHDLQGMIRHLLIDLLQLISSRDGHISVDLEHKFTGHNKSVQKLVRSSDGEALLTTSRFSENCVWYPQKLSHGVSLRLQNIIRTESPIKFAVVHELGKLVICLLENGVLQAWECPTNRKEDSEQKQSYLRAETTLEENKSIHPIVMLNTPELKHSHERHFIALIFSDGSIKAFEVSLTRGIFEVKSDALDIHGDDIYRISIIDPVHQTFFSNRPLISLVTKKGLTRTYKAIVNYDDRHVQWIKACEINTGIINPTCIRGSSTGKLCIVNSTGKVMSLWDLNRAVLEYEETFGDAIEDVDWTSTEYGQSIVSVGFTGYALLYTQLRYDYTNNTPSYLPIEKIDITAHTAHNIGDSIWMKNGTFIVASGNQFYIKDKSLDLKDPFTYQSIGSRKILSNDILHLSSVLNGPLPVYHPQFLIQAIYANKLQLVKELLLRLFLALRKLDFESQDVSNLDSNLGMNPLKFFIAKDRDYPTETFPDPYPNFNKTVSAALSEQLTKITLPYLTRHQQITLITVIEAVDEVTKDENVVDYNGVRFLMGVKLFLSHKNVQKSILMRDVSWALHSDNKEIILSFIDHHITSWNRACEYKIAYWIKEQDLVKKFEDIAKYEFSKDDKRDPSRCAIFYLALKKKQILLSLWRMAIGHPEQQKMIRFISNDFSVPRWRTAALKNAFVLLSKHRYMDAAVFFLLTGSLKDCVNVLCKQVGDMDMAIGVCRVYEGDNGPVLGELLTTQMLPETIRENDRWKASFIYWKLRKQEVAIKALMTAPIDLENNSEVVSKETCVNRSFLVEDPALLYLYNHLRNRNLKYFIGSLNVEAKIECTLILRVTDILCRMGCNYLAASLVKNWKFIERNSVPVQKLLESPAKDRTYSVIGAMTAEPTSTARMRPSLFDKFGSSNPSEAEPFKASTTLPSNLLDDFSQPPPNISSPTSLDQDSSSAPRSLLDDFASPFSSQHKENVAPSMLDGFTEKTENSENVNGKSLQSNFSSEEPQNPRKSAVTKNLLDDFM